MTKRLLRTVLTVLMYAGVLVFLFPYFSGRITAGVIFMLVGLTVTVSCGLLRCYLTEGDCGRIPHQGRDW
jgi:4-amino-4-deoxy-L-arabinose transferase-like glycosyltransferase